MVRFLGDATLVDQVAATLRYRTADGLVELTCCTPRIARLRLVDERAWPRYLEPRDWPAAPIEVAAGEPTTVTTGAMTLRIGTAPFQVTFGDAAGADLLRQGGTAARGAGTGTTTGAGGLGTATTTEGDRVRRRVEAWLDPVGEQHFYGLGQGGHQFDRLGGARQLWNSHVGHGPGSDAGIPLLVCNRGYALFFDNTCDARLTVGRSDGGLRIVYAAEDGPLDLYFLIAADMRGVMNEVAELLGRATLPPRWALGYLQSTRHFAGTDELRGLPRALRERRIPCDGLIWLSTYGDALGWNREVGHLEFQPELWPDPAGLVAEMREQRFELITHEYPVVHPESPLYAEAEGAGYLLAEGYPRIVASEHPNTNFMHGQRYLDFSNPDARRWWWAQHRPLRELGVAGWWLDGGEGPPASARLHGGDGVQRHNVFDRDRYRAFFEGESADRPDLRPVLLCRSGAAGMQRYAAGCWSGDINNTFATLELQVPWGLNMAMSGVPYWGTDIGGFFHPVPESPELFARWFQFGAFCPLFRAHGWVWREHVPWAHGSEVEAICRQYAELRYRLMPYTYTLAWQARTAGLPLMRPMVLGYPDDPRVWELGSQYLWGEDLLVAPVTREGARSWPVYLPAGGWYDFWTHERHEGGRGVAVDAPLDRLPLLVRAGAIVPLGPVVQHADERPLEEVTLLIYPEGRSRFELYEDDGRTNGYRRGAHATTPIECLVEGGATAVTVGEPGGDGWSVPAGRTYTLQVHGGPPRRVIVDGAELPRLAGSEAGGAGWWHDGAFAMVRTGARAPTVRIEGGG
jgi:alpha-glucosidase (family GH31 glycosyl hydrolase)